MTIMINTYFLDNKQEIITGVEPGIPEENSLLWTDMENPDASEIELLYSRFNFHPLAVEDCIKTMQRAKFDDYTDYCFIVMHSIEDSKLSRKIKVRELSIFVGLNYIVTFHHEPVLAVSQISERILKNPQLMSKGVDYILYLIVDAVIDEYFPVLDHLDDMFSISENRLLRSKIEDNLGELFDLKRAVIGMRKILSPHREMINALIRYEGVFIKEEHRVFYLDIYDHIMRMFDFLETYRDLISGSQELYLAVASNKMNEIVKTLTIIATIILPLTLISSIYGMNFRYMPELEWRYGYLWAISLMLATTGGLVYYFRKQKWF